MRNPRLLLAAGLLLGLLVVGGALLSSSHDPGSAGTQRGAGRSEVVRAGLTLQEFERPDTGPELLISLPKARLNTLRATGGRTSVTLTCFGATGPPAFSIPQPWPLMEELGFPLPHMHVPVGQRLLDTIRRCRLTGPGIDLQGSVPGRLPLAR
jgi:hypothetical protein